MSAVRNMEQSDYRFSFYSLARCDGGVSIDDNSAAAVLLGELHMLARHRLRIITNPT